MTKTIIRILTTICCLVYLHTQCCGQAMTIAYGPQSLAVGSPITITPVITGGTPSATGQTTITLAGTGSAGWYDGPATSATFDWPLMTAVDKAGNVYVADSENQVIRKIAINGTVSTFAGSGTAGSADGNGLAASFRHPAAIAIDNFGNLYIADQQNHKIRKITPTRQVSTYAGTGTAGSTNNAALSSTFNNPTGVAVDALGNVYVADYSNNKIRKINAADGQVSTLAGTGAQGSSNGNATTTATFYNPMGVAVDAAGNVYVSDRKNYLVRKIVGNSVLTLAGSGTVGFADGTGTNAQFNTPNHVAVDAAGNVYVADQANNRIRKITPGGQVNTVAGDATAGFANGTGSIVRFNNPFGLSLDKYGNIYVADYNNHAIRKVIVRPFTISPELPAGLTFNDANGTISGTPMEVFPETTFTITCYNATHTASTNLTLSVVNPNIINNNKNSITTYTPLTEITSETQLTSALNTPSQVLTEIQYFDGLSRVSQNITLKGNPSATADLIEIVTYDSMGREAVKYEPYTSASRIGTYRTNAITEQQLFYNQQNSDYKPTSKPYALTIYEASPYNRILEQGAPGEPWQPVPSSFAGHTVKQQFSTNASETIKLWTITSNGAASTSYYQPSSLTLTIKKDENWVSGKSGTIEEYRNSQNQILARSTFKDENTALTTYYLYDDLGILRYVLPPGFNRSSFTESTTDLEFNHYVYAYRYDSKKRLIEKKLPGKGWEYYIYNKLDQIVITQDANQRNKATQQASFTKYDIIGRIVMTGVCNVPGSPASGVNYRIQLQDLVDNQTQLWENRLYAGSAGTTDYTVNCIPTSNFTPLVVNYYDDYANIPDKQTFFIPTNGSYSNTTKGLLTATRTSILNSPTQVMKSFIYYDEKGRQSTLFKQHYKGGSSNYTVRNYDAYYTTYNLSNQITSVRRKHFVNDGTTTPKLALTILNEFQYDHIGRKVTNSKKIINEEQDETIIEKTIINKNIYNELGELLTKRLHSTDQGSSFLQDINYTYNERGWLSTATSNNNKLNLIIKYDNPATGINPAYNGNITQILYSGQYSGSQDLRYSYDKLNRLMASFSLDGLLNETLTYDNMGNIQTLTRGGQAYATLNYTYANNGQSNQLQTVSGSGFVSRNYLYDNNGNATSDGQQTINYNILDLPQTVIQGTTTKATYFYDALGTKVRSSQTGATKDYIDGIVYKGNTLEFIQTEEGRAIPVGTTGVYNYTYDLKDHLGNARVTIAKNVNGAAEVLQEDEYYAFGLRKQRFDASNGNLYLYNGKELQTDLNNQFDYGARFYDATIARWNSVDPLADSMRRYSPYTFCFNNPLRYIDPDGRAAFNEYEIVVRDGEIISIKMIGTKGENEKDYLTIIDLNQAPSTNGIRKVVIDVHQEATSAFGNADENSQRKAPTPGYREYHGTAPLEWWAIETLATGGENIVERSLLRAAAKRYALSAVKTALKKVLKELNEDSPLPKMKDGKFGSPQRGTSKKGYRLDSEGHPKTNNPAEKGPHINYWDYTTGKRGSGGKSGAIPIKD